MVDDFEALFDAGYSHEHCGENKPLTARYLEKNIDMPISMRPTATSSGQETWITRGA
jgi:hypothetical protein